MKMYQRHRVEMRDDTTRRIVFRDDDREGFALSILRAPDGDFHIGLTVVHDDASDFDQEHYGALWAKSLRVRMPMLGGGSHPELFEALCALFRAIPPTGAAGPSQ